MRKLLTLLVMVMFLSAGIAVAVWFSKGGTVSGTSEQKAIALYQAQKYEEALPLFKQWRKEVQNDVKEYTRATAYISDIEARLKPAAAGQTPVALAAPLDEAALMAQAAALALQQKAEIDETPRGADRIPHAAVAPGEVRTLSIKQLGNFEFDQWTTPDVPADIKLLDGATLRLVGFLMPQNQADNVTEFSLVPSIVGCCFGQPPGVEHVIYCQIPSDKCKAYAFDEIIVEGKLRVKVQKDQGYTYSIFEMDATSVKILE